MGQWQATCLAYSNFLVHVHSGTKKRKATLSLNTTQNVTVCKVLHRHYFLLLQLCPTVGPFLPFIYGNIKAPNGQEDLTGTTCQPSAHLDACLSNFLDIALHRSPKAFVSSEDELDHQLTFTSTAQKGKSREGYTASGIISECKCSFTNFFLYFQFQGRRKKTIYRRQV